MPHHQKVDLRVGFGEGINLGNSEAQRAHEHDCITARQQQRVPFAVAPRRTLTTPRGTLKPGDEVFETDFEGSFISTWDGNGREVRHPVAAWRALRDAVEDGRVLERP